MLEENNSDYEAPQELTESSQQLIVFGPALSTFTTFYQKNKGNLLLDQAKRS